MQRWMTFVFFIVAFSATMVSVEGCGQCSDENGSACWTTQAKRNANCNSKGWFEKNYCSRWQDGCGFEYCHCCGSSMNSGCKPQDSTEAKGEAAFKNDNAGWKCFPTESERNSSCNGYPKFCQGRRLFYAGRSSRKSNTYRTRMTYCCAKTAYPGVC